MDKILDGVSRFKRKVYPEQKALFHHLADQQAPEVLFITCSDSRIDTAMITQTAPGDLFICRNAGNIVPPHTLHTGGMTASIEYAVGVLNVSHIVICGHTDCGAMKGALNKDSLKELPHVCNWLSHSDAALQVVKENCSHLNQQEIVNRMIEENVVLQLQHIRTHPYVAARLAAGKLELHGWVYDIAQGNFSTYNEKTRKFEPMMDQERAAISGKRAG